MEEPSLFGAFVDGTLASYVETSHERWNNRLRISNILVEAPFRGMGVGRALFEQAENRAREVKARAVVLETQSCNVPAIRFYEKMGMGGGLVAICWPIPMRISAGERWGWKWENP